MIVGFLIGFAAGVAAAVGALTWLAFQPPSKWWPRR